MTEGGFGGLRFSFLLGAPYCTWSYEWFTSSVGVFEPVLSLSTLCLKDSYDLIVPLDLRELCSFKEFFSLRGVECFESWLDDTLTLSVFASIALAFRITLSVASIAEFAWLVGSLFTCSFYKKLDLFLVLVICFWSKASTFLCGIFGD